MFWWEREEGGLEDVGVDQKGGADYREGERGGVAENVEAELKWAGAYASELLSGDELCGFEEQQLVEKYNKYCFLHRQKWEEKQHQWKIKDMQGGSGATVQIGVETACTGVVQLRDAEMVDPMSEQEEHDKNRWGEIRIRGQKRVVEEQKWGAGGTGEDGVFGGVYNNIVIALWIMFKYLWGIVSDNTEITYETSHHFDLEEGETKAYHYF